MSTLTTATARLTDTILDLEYGDEQERFRYYEAYAVIVHLQLLVLPAIGAVAVFALGVSAIAPLLAFLAAIFGCMLFGRTHLERYHVPIELIALSGRNRTYVVLYALSWAFLMVALATAGIGESGFGAGFAIGASVGAAVGLAVLVIRARRQRSMANAAAAEDPDMDDANGLSS